MNKTEKAIILKQYHDMFYAQSVLEIDKSDSIREFSFLLKTLGMTKEKFEVENKILAEEKGITGTTKEMYSLIFESFAKYNCYVNYDLKEIDLYYDSLEWKMTQEKNKCHKARISYLTN